ncbi:hypothetical protein GCM10023153_06620 [Ornithinibacter aureus]|uniref:YcxB-like C-terminal domain-containing protein n=2 Tax=Ornithinibacter aureus TaxID=622664 RepID=A0ABP8JF56_9MICO|nr:YcxB-like protein [Ornithinibacter aureus]
MSMPDSLGPLPQRIDYHLSAEDYVAFNLHAARTMPEYERQIAQARLWGAVLMAGLAVVFGLVLFDAGVVATGVLAVLGAGGWWLFSPWSLRRSIRRSVERIGRTSGLGVVGPATLLVDEVGMREYCGAVTHSVPWSAIVRVEETAEHGFIFVAPMAALVVPKRAAGAGAVLALARERAGNG